MQHLEDFFSFKYFISPYVLFIFYYMGALGVPIASWLFTIWVKKKYWLVADIYTSGKKMLITTTRKKHRVWFLLLFGFLFLWMEIMWRMMFEFLIAYLQIRDALLVLVP
ncbi:MAG TPA: DUF4282 domain-containing protein [Thiothrix sp.]|nr:DUF4282 domain-containing protein [Thiothrix sp.]